MQTLRGRVLEPSGLGLAGVQVGFRMSSTAGEAGATAISGSGGFFELPLPGGSGYVTSVDERFVTLLASSLGGVDHEYLVAVAPRIALAGTVVDQRDQAVSDVAV